MKLREWLFTLGTSPKQGMFPLRDSRKWDYLIQSATWLKPTLFKEKMIVLTQVQSDMIFSISARNCELPVSLEQFSPYIIYNSRSQSRVTKKDTYQHPHCTIGETKAQRLA